MNSHQRPWSHHLSSYLLEEFSYRSRGTVKGELGRGAGVCKYELWIDYSDQQGGRSSLPTWLNRHPLFWSSKADVLGGEDVATSTTSSACAGRMLVLKFGRVYSSGREALRSATPTMEYLLIDDMYAPVAPSSTSTVCDEKMRSM